MTKDPHPATNLKSKTGLEALDLLRDVYRGLADVEAGRVVPHDEARVRLLARYRDL